VSQISSKALIVISGSRISFGLTTLNFLFFGYSSGIFLVLQYVIGESISCAAIIAVNTSPCRYMPIDLSLKISFKESTGKEMMKSSVCMREKHVQ
jgi:hypothetical protein